MNTGKAFKTSGIWINIQEFDPNRGLSVEPLPNFYLETRGRLLQDCDGSSLCVSVVDSRPSACCVLRQLRANAKIVALKCCSVAACEG